MASIYLIPTHLSNAPLSNVLPDYNFKIIKQIKYFIVENIRTARRFLKQVDRTINIDELTFFELNEHTDKTLLISYIEPIKNNNDIGIISEAGCPAIADPGADIVSIAQEKNIKVVPLVGPSSILLSLMASGFNGQSFAFNGYLPIDKNERINTLKRFEKKIFSESQTQIFIETPYRNVQLVEDICKTLSDNIKLCIAVDITSDSEIIKTKTIRQWKSTIDSIGTIHKKPTIFLLYK
ncbi:MAG: SAM-dependent methyltransferase [Bacteroidales bacterium]|nr:SAM-dependent methyltransferase [Bacteroidales bacterium]MDD5974164.1 SAM-dependent methyltransferase [Bacteroidales bacterium]MDY5193796.1 SAM-dependent methyltransferase [Candidatus Aphodosoma sp.]